MHDSRTRPDASLVLSMSFDALLISPAGGMLLARHGDSIFTRRATVVQDAVLGAVVHRQNRCGCSCRKFYLAKLRRNSRDVGMSD